ncbi:MAG TPA: iron-sulfur cluster assembly scaffold protein [Candidatus Xenobia bacterium]|nr:iron-sulfur cluster assembly scaffold protein [Candidatus Xenobia bacterium]
MFSQQVLDHFQNPRNAGDLDGATATVERANPVCGDVLRVAARVEAGRVVEARFKCSGCVPAMAAGSVLTELVKGRGVEELSGITEGDVIQALGGLPPASRHAAQLAVETLRALRRALA